MPEKWEHYIELNERLAEKWDDRIINETMDAMDGADEWATKEDKLDELQEEW